MVDEFALVIAIAAGPPRYVEIERNSLEVARQKEVRVSCLLSRVYSVGLRPFW